MLSLREDDGDMGVLNSAAMVFTVFGETAFTSIYVRLGAEESDSVPLRSARRFMAAWERVASRVRRAVAIASLGGTMLRIMSASATRSSSLLRVVICAEAMRSRVCWLV